VYVTHDQIEAMTLADRIVILDRGVIQQVGTPEEVFNKPRNIFVAGFIGSPGMNLFAAKADGAGSATLDAGATRIALPQGINPTAGAAIIVGIRPQGLRLAAANNETIALNVAVTEYLGTETVLTGVVGTASVTAVVAGNHSHSAGQVVHLAIAPEHVHVFDAATQLNLNNL
jgi:ABC-type sugar transport system ATPase subunit